MLKTTSTFKKVSTEKSIILLRKKKSIRNYIVKTDTNKANEKKKFKVTTSCSLCRKTYYLINSDETLQNIHNVKEVKKLDGENLYGTR